MRHKKSHLFFTIIFVQSAELNVPANFPLKFYPKNIYILIQFYQFFFIILRLTYTQVKNIDRFINSDQLIFTTEYRFN